MSTSTATHPRRTRLQRTLRGIGEPLRMWPLLVGLPSPPYTRRNAIIIETIGRRSGKRRRLPVGFLEEERIWDDKRLPSVSVLPVIAALGSELPPALDELGNARDKLIVVVEDGLHAAWVRNALARDGQLRVFLHGRWRDVRLQPRPGDPEPYLRRMNRVHAAFVHVESSVPEVVEITPE